MEKIRVGKCVIELEDNTNDVLKEFKEAKKRAMWRIGEMLAEAAKKLCPVDTGLLRNSITHYERGSTVNVGTANEYAAYVELGTGIYAENGDGRQTAWSYQDALGNWHRTRGQESQPFIRPAFTQNLRNIERILADELED